MQAKLAYVEQSMNTLVWKNSPYVILNIKQSGKIHIYRRNYKIQLCTIISVTFKLHKFLEILQINKLYIVSTEISGTSVRHGARCFACF